MNKRAMRRANDDEDNGRTTMKTRTQEVKSPSLSRQQKQISVISILTNPTPTIAFHCHIALPFLRLPAFETTFCLAKSWHRFLKKK
jgi:hypothetical protein